MNYKNKISNGGTVIIGISPFSLLVNDYELDKYNYKYYNVIKGKDIINYSAKKNFY